jgi:uncharacterized protein (DUF983 family)
MISVAETRCPKAADGKHVWEENKFVDKCSLCGKEEEHIYD